LGDRLGKILRDIHVPNEVLAQLRVGHREEQLAGRIEVRWADGDVRKTERGQSGKQAALAQ